MSSFTHVEISGLCGFGESGWWSWRFIEGHAIRVLYEDGFIVAAEFDAGHTWFLWEAESK